MNTEGYYSIEYSGIAGWRIGQIVLDTGVIVGSDAAGGKHDGTYEYNPRTDMLDLKFTLTVPPNVPLVMGIPPQGKEYKVPIETSIPKDLGGEHPIKIETMFGPVGVVIKKLRDFPH